MQKGEWRGTWYERRLPRVVISAYHLLMGGGARRHKLPLGNYVNKPLSRNLSRKSSSKECLGQILYDKMNILRWNLAYKSLPVMGMKGTRYERRLLWEVISSYHLPMVGGARRHKLPLGSYVDKPLSRNLSRKSSSKEWYWYYLCLQAGPVTRGSFWSCG